MKKPEKVSSLLKKSNATMNEAQDAYIDGDIKKAVKLYRRALQEMIEVEERHPTRAKRAEFAPLRFRKALCETEIDRIMLEEVTAKDVLDAAKAGDAVADQIFDKFCDYLGYSLAATAAVIDPEIFILGGGVSKAGQFLVDRVHSYFVKYAWTGIRDIKFALAELGNDAGICGAASIVVDR